jgi:hypothetical protein
MSIERLNDCFSKAEHSTDWSLQLLKITSKSHENAKYAVCQISLSPQDRLNNQVKSLAKKYLGNEKGALSTYTTIQDYDGSVDGLTIYKLSADNPLISREYEALIRAASDPDVEADPCRFQSASIIRGSLDMGAKTVPVKFISMQNPMTTLKNKFSLINRLEFRELNGPVLSLKNSIDVVIIDKTVYFLTLAGENLFNMTRAYRAVCHEAVENVEAAGFVSGMDKFKQVAESGHNPRRFVSFAGERLEVLKNVERRKEMAKQFSIPLDADNKLDATVDGAAEKIVKLLCKKGMVDPFIDRAVEVANAKQWK